MPLRAKDAKDVKLALPDDHGQQKIHIGSAGT
jgi:hypothetical protein